MSDSTTPSEETTENKSNQPKPSSKGQSKVAGLSLVLCTAALLGCAYLWQQVSSLRESQTQFESSLKETTKNNVAGLSTKLLALNREFVHFKKTFQLKPSQRVTLLEVHQMINAARLKLTLHHEVGVAMTLLNEADDILAKLNMPALLPLRESIHTNVRELASLPKTDVEGVMLTLRSLSQQAPDLPLSEQIIQSHSTKATATSDNTKEKVEQQSRWHQAFDATLAKLSNIVIIRKHEEHIKPLLSKEEMNQVVERLQLVYQTAQVALLNHQEKAYHLALKDANQLLVTYFTPTAASVASQIEEVKRLDAKELYPKGPNLNSTLQLVDTLLTNLPVQEQQPANKQAEKHVLRGHVSTTQLTG